MARRGTSIATNRVVCMAEEHRCYIIMSGHKIGILKEKRTYKAMTNEKSELKRIEAISTFGAIEATACAIVV